MKRILIFASGSGSNAENIIQYFWRRPKMAVQFELYTNNEKAGVVDRARRLQVPCGLITKEQFNDPALVDQLGEADLIVLAGFLLLIPDFMVKHYAHKIINIHPALLPAYGGKGMYGDKVHQAVIDKKEQQSGISIHYVNEKYDEGQIILQARCELSEGDTAETLAEKIHKLEYTYYPIVIEQLISN
jgi:phosphoribosylglycinamide formyltransferase-1